MPRGLYDHSSCTVYKERPKANRRAARCAWDQLSETASSQHTVIKTLTLTEGYWMAFFENGEGADVDELEIRWHSKNHKRSSTETTP